SGSPFRPAGPATPRPGPVTLPPGPITDPRRWLAHAGRRLGQTGGPRALAAVSVGRPPPPAGPGPGDRGWSRPPDGGGGGQPLCPGHRAHAVRQDDRARRSGPTGMVRSDPRHLGQGRPRRSDPGLAAVRWAVLGVWSHRLHGVRPAGLLVP